jgi:hypothetical protein
MDAPDFGFNESPGGLRGTPPGSRIQVIEDSRQRLVLCILGRGSHETQALWATGVLSLLATVGSVWAIGLMAKGLPENAFIKGAIAVGVAWVSLLYFLFLTIQGKFERTFLLLECDRLVVQRVLLGFSRKATVELIANSRAQLIKAGGPEVTTDGVKVTGRNRTLTFGNLLSTEQNGWLVERINAFLAPNSAVDPGGVIPRSGDSDPAPSSAKDSQETRSPDRSPTVAKTSPSPAVVTAGCRVVENLIPQVALARGPFRPPADFAFEPELQPPVPRPVPAYADSLKSRMLRDVQSFFLVLGAMFLGLSGIASEQQLMLHVAGYGLLALWGVSVLGMAYVRHARPVGCPYVQRGQPVVARIVGLVNTSMLLNGVPFLFNHIVALIEYRDPDSPELCWAEVESEPFPTLERANYTTSFRVGDYVTAIYLPGKRLKSLTLFSFLGHDKSVGVVRRLNYPRLLRVVLACLLLAAPVPLLEAGSYISHFYKPIDFDNSEQTKLIGCGLLASAVVLLAGLAVARWLNTRFTTRRNAYAIVNGEPLELDPDHGEIVAKSLGLAVTLGAIVGGLIVSDCAWGLNAWLDISPARIQRLELERLEAGHSDTSYKGYSIVYREHRFHNARRHGSSPREVQAWLQAGANAGDAEIHEGYFGWRWIKTIQPVVAAPLAPVNQPGLKQR